MRSVKDKVVVITGASRGIGAGIAAAFAGDGARLVLCGRNKARLDKVAKSLDLPNDRFITVIADITKPAGMRKIINAAYRKFDAVDIFVNNAGIGARKNLVDSSEKDYNLIFDTNLKSAFFCFKELLPRLLKQGHGQIINISSMASRTGVPGLALYSASKAALNTLSEAVAGEVRNDNIKICVLSPGSTDTNFMSGRSRKPSARHRATIRLQVDEVAEAVLFLAKQNSGAWTSMADIRPLVVKRS